MPKELGESVKGTATTTTKESDGTGSAGDFVTLNASGQVTPTATADDDIYGVLAEDSPAAGENVGVHIEGVVAANVAGTVADGDALLPTATAGQWDTNAAGLVQAVDEGGTATYTIGARGIQAYSDAGGTYDGASLAANAAAVKLP